MSTTATAADFISGSSARHRSAGRQRSRVPRIIFSLALLGAAVLMIVRQETVRYLEAGLAASWINTFIAGGASSFQDLFYIQMSPTSVTAFRVTVECTSVILIAPLLAAAAFAMLSRRVAWMRGVIAVATMLAVITVVNQLRLGLIATMSQSLGMDLGYDLSHKILGSILGIVGFVIGAGLMICIMGFRRRGAAIN